MRTRVFLFLVAIIATLIVFVSAHGGQSIEVPAHEYINKGSGHSSSQLAHTKPSVHTTPVTTSSNHSALAVCGNGIIEHGEECDCGSLEECSKDPCCNAKTCQLALGAQCSNQQDCCDKCQYRPSTFVCRAATSDCDTQEMCTGKSGKCPAKKKECDKHNPSPTTTSTNSTTQKPNTMCGSIPCTDRDLQCQARSSVLVNFTTACSKDVSTCSLSCTDPSTALTGSPSCITLFAYFADGTECGQDGICNNGECIGDKSAVPFLKKNTIVFVIGGVCVVAALFFCFLSIFFLRRRKRENEKKQENSYPMVENPSYRRRSNIRIGLDPIDIDDILPSYDSKGSLTRRISAGYQNAPFRSGRLENPYAADSLMSEQDMALDLESDYNKKVNPSASTWQTVPISKAPAYRPPPPDFTKKSSIQKSNSNHTIYIPPPLPPATVTSPRVAGGPSPYADEAMIIHPLKSSPSPSLSMAKSVSSGLGRSHAVAQMPMTHATATARKDKNEQKESNNTDMEDDELSELYLDSTLAVGGYTNTTSISAKDRASVSSFFSTLVVDPEPAPPLPPFTPLLPSFASEEFIIPAPVARIVPVTSTTTTRTTASPRPSPKIQQSDYDKQQEEIQVAACFAQDLGFEIVSPMTSPRSKAAIPFGQRRI